MTNDIYEYRQSKDVIDGCFGKTHTLTSRVAHKPKRTLMLTFTNDVDDEMKELIQELKAAEAERVPEVQNIAANISNGERIMALLNPRKDQIKIGQDYVEIEIQHLGINFSCSTTWWNAQSNEKACEELEKRYNRNNKTDY